ncbi:Outer membrane protein TolC [Reichenbachiella agariperforans]|uniref:Outer membrane protein TolC n=1 Tax=Reichenbachiella agariperforans TaxID=156994 RepID=A0A1M6RTT7_REIAG|nr:TolC family protein [Reichenbachiella agariperforans]SHK35836.1 Outer membrane protein TolC [Reichenbachiella agariperforans]
MKTMFNRIILLMVSLCWINSNLTAQSLDDYLQSAAENNPGLKASYAEFEAAMQRVSQAHALPDPTLSFGYFISPIETRLGPQRAKISLTQMFPWFGTLRAREDAAAKMAEARYQTLLDAKNELYFKVKQAYYPIYEVKQQIHWQQKNLEILASYKALSTTSFASGRGSMVDVIRTDIMMDDTQTTIQLLENKIAPLEIVLNRLLNRADTAAIIVSDSLGLMPSGARIFRDSLLVQNPKLQALTLQQEAAKANERMAKKSGAPQFGVGLDYAFVGKREDMDIPDNGRNTIMPMVTMTLPIFRSKYKAAVQEAQFTQTALAHRRMEMTNSLVSSYEMADYAVNQAAQLYQLYDQQIVKTRQAIDLLYTAYSNSGKEFEEVLRMQQQLLKYEMEKATAIKNYYLAQAQLDYLTAKSE